eukprot:8091-Heterococcus_DN1.PRE.7
MDTGGGVKHPICESILPHWPSLRSHEKAGVVPSASAPSAHVRQLLKPGVHVLQPRMRSAQMFASAGGCCRSSSRFVIQHQHLTALLLKAMFGRVKFKSRNLKGERARHKGKKIGTWHQAQFRQNRGPWVTLIISI